MVLKIRTYWTDSQAKIAGAVSVSGYEAWHYVEGRSFSIYSCDIDFDSEGRSVIDGEQNFVCGVANDTETKLKCYVALYSSSGTSEPEAKILTTLEPSVAFLGNSIYFNTMAYLLNEHGSTVECIPAIVPVQDPETGVRSFRYMR